MDHRDRTTTDTAAQPAPRTLRDVLASIAELSRPEPAELAPPSPAQETPWAALGRIADRLRTLCFIAVRQRPARRIGRKLSGARRREHRPATRRRAGASSRTSGSDPGGDDPPAESPPELRLWRHPRHGACNPRLLRVLLETEAQR